MNQISNVMKMQGKDKWMWLFYPCLIMLINFLINIIVRFFLEGKEPIYTGGLLAILVYMFVMGTVTLTTTFPYALGFSVRRKDYFLGTLGFALIINLVLSAIILLFAFVEFQFLKGWGNMYFFYLPYVNTGSIFSQLWIYFGILIHLYVFGLFLASVSWRYGGRGSIIFYLSLLILSTIGIYIAASMDLWSLLPSYSAVEFVTWVTPLTIVYTILAFWLIRKTVIK